MVNKALEETYKIIDGKDNDPDYARIYFSSNEPLNLLFQYFDVEGKDVLSVMASGDQPLHALYRDAKSVDTYDVNCLAEYYYYLRYWGILYLDQFYPDKSILTDHHYIYELLQKVKPQNEEEERAYVYWNSYIRNVFPFDSGNLFYINSRRCPIEDIQTLKEKIRGKEIHFQHLDLFENFSLPKKYDIIITSNILEYAGHSSLHLKRCCHNLKTLLREGGKVISSHVLNNTYSSFFVFEKDIFRDSFDYHEFPTFIEEFAGKRCSLGYSYTKK